MTAIGQKAPKDAAAQLQMLSEIIGMNPPASLDGVLAREVRFKDAVKPDEMMEYVMRKAVGA